MKSARRSAGNLPLFTAIALFSLLGLATTASAETFSPAEDTYARSDYPDANFGRSTSLRVDGSPWAGAYLRFRVEGLSAPVKRATLRVYARTTVTTSGLDLRPITSSRWSEWFTTFRNAPSVGSSVANSGLSSSGRWVSIDATRLVTGNGTVDLALTTRSTTSRTLGAREDAAAAPRLEIETEAPTPDPTPDPGTLGPRARYRGAQSHPMWSGTLDQAYRELDRLQAAGADSVRVDLGWDSLETSGDGAYSSSYLSKADSVVHAAAVRNLKVVLVFWGTPCWASSAPDTVKQSCSGAWWDRNVHKYPPSDPAEYGEAAAFLAARYGDKLAAFEVWNEPNETGQNFLISSDPAAAYARIVKAAYQPIKNANPSLPVIVGSLSFADRAFLSRLYNLGIQPYHDGIAIHPYNESRDPDERRGPGFEKWTYRDAIPWIRELMVQRGDADKGLWLTEFGWSTCGTGSSWCVTQEKQKEYIEEAFRIQREDNWRYVKAMLVYNLRNKGTAATDREDQFGLLYRDFSEKPGWAGFTEAMRRW